MRYNSRYILFIAFLWFILPAHRFEEGMFPLSQLKQVNLQDAGFRIGEKDIYNPDGIALTDALVRLGGCTGSFVSDKGLIITNHHCVFGSVAALSSKENDYLENGFYAKDKGAELKTGLTCKITRSYEDVSIKVLDGINLGTEPLLKKQMIQKNCDALLEKERAMHPGMTIEISEMLVGYSYTLFRYDVLRDVRLVYVPPRSIGEFGGETDNWEWPKHTGDFSFVRAYVGKDGKPADYSPDNIPFVPRKHLKINPKGTREGDLVFILGYPGKTYRNEPYQFISYQQDHVLPFISEWYGWRMNLMEKTAQTDRDRYLRLAGTIKQLANVKKNFEGKIYGLKQTGLLEQKKSEQDLLRMTMENKGAETRFFNKIDSLYAIRLQHAQNDLLLGRLGSDCAAFYAAMAVESMKEGKAPKPSDSAYWKSWKTKLRSRLENRYRMQDTEIDRLTLAELIRRIKKSESLPQIKMLKKIKNEEAWTKKAWDKTFYDDPAEFYALIEKSPWEVYNHRSALQKLLVALNPLLKTSTERNTLVTGSLDALLPQLLESRMKFANKAFIPDANSTLRFTYGTVKGYREDLNSHPYPFTFREELLSKNATDNTDYRLSEPVKDLLNKREIAQEFLDPETGDVVLCMLYNMDTTGGNSGSPVMDADGNLVGVNFDRAYTATLNDYSWNTDYSRSIAVDIRYVLFTMKYLNQADNLLQEMNVQL